MENYNFIGNYGDGIFDKKGNYIVLGEKIGEIFREGGIGSPILMPSKEHREKLIKEGNRYVLVKAGFNSLLLFPTLSELLEHGNTEQRLRYLFNSSDHHVFLKDSGREFKLTHYLWEHAKNFGEELAVFAYCRDILEIGDAKQIDHFLETFPLTDEDLEEVSQLFSEQPRDVPYTRVRLNSCRA